MIDQILPLRVRGRRHLVRVQEKTRSDDGTARVLLKGPPEALRRLEGYTFAAKDSGEPLTLTAVQLVPPPDGGEPWIAFAEACSTSTSVVGR